LGSLSETHGNTEKSNMKMGQNLDPRLIDIFEFV